MSDVLLTLDGRQIHAQTGATVAAAIMNNEVMTFRQSITGDGRGPLCGMGTCWECRVTVDGRAHVRACMEPVRDGMEIQTVPAAWYHPPKGWDRCGSREELSADVVVVGAGPAGLAAALAAAMSGSKTLVIDENPTSGGQIWRADRVAGPTRRATALRQAAEDAGARFVHASVTEATLDEIVAVRPDTRPLQIRSTTIVLATGARETWSPFPGWTLPGVVGAGGLQALVKGGLHIRGRRVLVAGHGPLLLAVAAYLRRRGADLVGIAAGWSRGRERALLPRLLTRPSKLRQAASLLSSLRGVRRWYDARLISASGPDQVRTATIRADGSDHTLDVDYVAYGCHLVPQTELARGLGCHIDRSAVLVNDLLQTSVDGVFSAGEATGIGGVDLALVEGTIAGYAAAGRHDQARRHLRRQRRERRFADAVTRAFVEPMGPESLHGDTVICRCEDVSWRSLSCFEGANGARDGKLATRCGMGPCQGRVCGPINQAMLGWAHDRVRPPLQPTSVETLVQRGARENEHD